MKKSKKMILYSIRRIDYRGKNIKNSSSQVGLHYHNMRLISNQDIHLFSASLFVVDMTMQWAKKEFETTKGMTCVSSYPNVNVNKQAL